MIDLMICKSHQARSTLKKSPVFCSIDVAYLFETCVFSTKEGGGQLSHEKTSLTFH